MEWLKILPPLVAVFFVIWKKEVILALMMAIFTSEWLLIASHESLGPVIGGLNTLERIVEVFSDPGNTRILIFSLMVGALLSFMRVSGGVTALVKKLISKGLAKSARQVSLMASFTGVAVFIESNLSVLTAGILSRGLFDKFGISRAKLAYIIDSTSAPVCILILLNAWGAYVLALLGNYELGASSAEILWGTIPFNFYAIITLAIVFYTAYTGKYYGPLATSLNNEEIAQKALAENLAQTGLVGTGSAGKDLAGTDVAGTELASTQTDTSSKDLDEENENGKARYMLLPLLTMIGGMVGFMFWTGDGVMSAGSGSKSVLYATTLACMVAYAMMLMSGHFKHTKLVKIAFEGMSELLPLVAIVLLSLALGSSLKELGTGIYIAQIVGDFLPLYLVAPMIFIVGGVIAFSTGTSWGTFAILIPIGIPIIETMGLPASFILAAILGGGVFGDHCSPISDTTAVSAIASGCDLLEHVKTQLPYAATGGVITIFAYLITGLIIL
ncbi:MAG: sodium:proton antiporter [Gammaproteobacteria bacterium]|nr:MAG: sodium:proton antiporter [Gammaproteobacteria bacterium]